MQLFKIEPHATFIGNLLRKLGDWYDASGGCGADPDQLEEFLEANLHSEETEDMKAAIGRLIMRCDELEKEIKKLKHR